ncbi:MAG: hypothetical protein EZS28_055408, partial [Streblomastix strix]
VTTMVSVEGESVELSEPVSTRMAVETWLLNFESAMCLTIRDQIQITLQAHSVTPRTEWIFKFPAQAILAVDQITWTAGATEALESDARSEQKGIHPGQEQERSIRSCYISKRIISSIRKSNSQYTNCSGCACQKYCRNTCMREIIFI